MAYPSTIDAPDTTMQGGSLVATNDHALDHRQLGSAVIAVETFLGTNAGTNIAKSFNAGDFPARINSSNVLQQSITGTVNLAGQATNTGTVGGGAYGTLLMIGGTATNLVLGTPSVDVLSARNSGSAIGFANSMYPSEGTITDNPGGTYAVNAQSAQIYYSVMGTTAGNRTIGTPTSPTAFQQLTYAFKTSGSANGTLVWTAIHRFSQNIGTPTLGTGVGWNYYSWRYNSLDTKWDYLGQSLNLI